MSGRHIFQKVTLNGKRLWLNTEMQFGIVALPEHIEEQPDGSGLLRSDNKPGAYGYALVMQSGRVVRHGKTLGKSADIEKGWKAE